MASQLNTSIPKLPAKDLDATRIFYTEKLGFTKVGESYPDYLILYKDKVELHFFLHRQLDVNLNYSQCYIRVTGIDEIYQAMKAMKLSGLGRLESKPWKQKEFSVKDIQNNLITFGEGI